MKKYPGGGSGGEVAEPRHVEEERPVVGWRADIEPVGAAELPVARSGREVRPLQLIRAAGGERHPLAALLRERADAVELGVRPRLAAHEHGAEQLVEDVAAEQHDNVALRLLDALVLERGECQHGRPQRLVADEPAEARDAEDAARRQMIEVLAERLPRVEIRLGEREAGGRVRAQRVREADVDDVVAGVAGREAGAAVTDVDRHARQRVRRAGPAREILVHDVADRPVELDHVDPALPGAERVLDVATAAAADHERPPWPRELVADTLRARA